MSKSLSGSLGAPLSRSALAATKHRRFIIRLTILIAGGMFIDGFILGGIGTVMPAITRELHLSPTWQGLIGASALFGIFVGGPLGGWLADRVGRRPMFTIDLAIFLVGSVAQFFVAEAWQLFLVRALMGLAIGADYAIGWPLLAEFAPARSRGKLLAMLEVAWYVGYLIAYAAGCLLTLTDSAGWHVILGLSAIPTAAVFLMRLGTPESPRWLMSRGRRDEARRVAVQYMGPDELADLHAHGTAGRLGFMRLFSRDYLATTVFVCTFWVCNVTPYFAIGVFAPIVLAQLGLQDGLTGGLALNGFAVLGTVLAVMLVERVGRRRLGIPPFFISAAALLGVAVFAHASSSVVLTGFVVFAVANAVAGTLTGVYPGEVFPTEIRGVGVGFATAVSRIGGALGTFLLPGAIAAFGIGTIMIVAALVSLVGGIVSYWLAPETRGKPLGEISAPASRRGRPAAGHGR